MAVVFPTAARTVVDHAIALRAGRLCLLAIPKRELADGRRATAQCLAGACDRKQCLFASGSATPLPQY